MPNQTKKTTMAQRMKWAREEAGLSQKEVVETLKISQPTLSALETGGSQGSRHIAQFAEIYGVDPVWLSTGEGKPESETHILNAYNRLNTKHRQLVMDLINSLAPEDSKEEK